MDKTQTHRTAMKSKTLLPSIYLISIFQLCIYTTAHGAYPPDYTAIYDVDKYGATVGRSTIALKQSKDEMHYSQNVELVGFISWFKSDRVAEDSWLSNNDSNSFLLKKYQYVHSHSNKNRDSLIEASWGKNEKGQLTGTITGKMRGNTVSIQSNEKVWDTLSFQLALMNDASENKNIYHYNVISRGKIKQYTFTNAGKETIEINDKEYKTVIFERHNGRKFSKIWLATELHYIPVLIEKYKDGDLDSTMTLDTIRFSEIQKQNTAAE